MLWPMIALSNIAQGSAVLAMIVLQKKNTKAQEVNIPACISCYLGVTEPAIFGVNLKYTFPFICGMIGSACAAVASVAMSTTANAIGVGGIPGILSIQPQYMLNFAGCMLIAIVVPFILTFIVGRKKLNQSDIADETGKEMPESVKNEYDNVENTTKEACMKAFLTGEVISLKDVNDGVFSEGILGDGVAIRPENDTLCSPVDAEVSALMEESRHAVGLTMDNGMVVLLHIGIDTVDMKGNGFTYLVTQGQKVKAGDPLIKFDAEKIRAAGHPDVTVCVVTEQGSAGSLTFYTGIHAEAGKTKIAEMKE